MLTTTPNPKLRQDTLEEILGCNSLPSLPAVAVRVIELTSDQYVSMDELAMTIQNDQGLASKVLRTVNSSYYGLREKCSTIRRAIVVLGLNAVKSLALGFSLVEALDTEGKAGDPFDYVAYWRRGLYTAVGARSVAAAARLPEADEAFLGGLLQDVGMYAMKAGLGDAYLRVYEAAAGDHSALHRAESAAFEVTHADIGALLTERWRLPESLIMPVKYHERPTACPVDHRTLVRAVAVGNIAHDALTLENRPHHVKLFFERAKSWFGLEESQIDGLLDEISRGAEEMSSLFKLDTGSYTDAKEVVSQARSSAIEITLKNEEAPRMPDGMQSLISGGDDYDPITDLVTGAAAKTLLTTQFEQAKSENLPLSALRIILNGIPPIQGETVLDADRLVIAAANLVRKHFEPLGGVAVRAGNTHFDVYGLSITRQAMTRAAEELRAEFEEAKASWITSGRDPGTLSISIGAASLDAETNAMLVKPELLVKAAIRAAGAASTATSNSGQSCVRVFRPKAK